MPILVNDLHSQLNPTLVDQIIPVDSMAAIRQVIDEARRQNKAISIAGKRHAMGGQQFGADTILIDTTPLNKILQFNREEGWVEVEAGIQWPELIDTLISLQAGAPKQWGIAQKQTGADHLTLGGTIAANGHGRGLRMRPIIADIESLQLVDAQGNLQSCSRTHNSELFRLVIGGYGLFGAVYAIKLRLAPRRKLERVVELISLDELAPAFEQRIAAGFLYGDFQFAIDEQSADFLRRGVFSCYRPVPWDTPVPEGQKALSDQEWLELIYLSHADKRRAFQRYSDHYLATSGQIYWSDTHQLSPYFENYHHWLDQKVNAAEPGSEIITEIYVPRDKLVELMSEVAHDFRQNGVNVIYGTIRLIEQDQESFLAWAKQPYACIIFNLHTPHTPGGIEHSANAFRRLIDMAIKRGGSYFLTYHKFATRRQVETCYPQFPEFLRLKRIYDPDERFQNDWYRHYKTMFADLCYGNSRYETQFRNESYH
jgi:FAD/FMN-containing dehydrogenase